MESSSPRARAQVSWRVARNCDGGACVRPVAAEINWRRSTSCHGGTCLEVASLGDMIAIRDSSKPDGPIITYAFSRWCEFVQMIKDGAFDELI